MIDFYTWSSPNGAKVRIMLEETGLDYELHPVNLGEREQKTPEYLVINPNGKVPAIADIACFPRMRNHQRFGLDFADSPNVERWLNALSTRPAVERGLALL